MKQLTMTPELAAMIHKSVGPDVDTTKLAVFEAIALNTKPLPGKRGTIFEKAVVAPLTLSQMVDYVNTPGKHLPVISDHDLSGEPKGRFFHAALHYDGDSLDSLEMRALFYLDETEAVTISKLNASSLDEVSVAFLSSAFNCSECGWDYFQFGDANNINNRTCTNGHTIGEDGVHADMVGLNQFIEISLVARGAADTPKIVGRSQSKLAPESAYRLAAKGFDTDSLVLRASLGKEDEVQMDTAKLLNDYVASTGQVATLSMEKTQLTASNTDLTTKLAAAEADVARLTTELAAAKTALPADHETVVAERTEAVTLLQAQVNALLVATGKPKLEGDAMPSKIAELKAKITELTDGLTAILPVEGKGKGTGADGEGSEAKLSFNPSAYTLRK